MNIVLFGFMGTGKSAVAQVLARRLSLRWVDMDHVIEEREKCSIEEIFEKKGEAFFRQRERDLVRELTQQNDLVISTGGGVVLNSQNMNDFEKWGFGICLSASLDVILERTQRSFAKSHFRSRPLLKGAHPTKRIEELLAMRRPYYERISHQIDTTGKSVHDVVETIVKWVE
ncbi:MAG: shikimate kinase [Chlamydiae bacterium]|nr:shikimate kinase [Chlamydiota bacterium]MBI3265693.1 shikimate kinase [Chlamydiota bacterium]